MGPLSLTQPINLKTQPDPTHDTDTMDPTQPNPTQPLQVSK